MLRELERINVARVDIGKNVLVCCVSWKESTLHGLAFDRIDDARVDVGKNRI